LNPLEYAHVVKEIGNSLDLSNVNLEKILPSATVMVITMASSTSNGVELDSETWKRVDEACDVMFQLEETRHKILNYVASRMQLIAPNLSAIIGTSTAAKLMGSAGGLTALCKIPACNIQVS
jgi:U4/U6 small nuclear ribonucleoprotein PRP31